MLVTSHKDEPKTGKENAHVRTAHDAILEAVAFHGESVPIRTYNGKVVSRREGLLHLQLAVRARPFGVTD